MSPARPVKPLSLELWTKVTNSTTAGQAINFETWMKVTESAKESAQAQERKEMGCAQG